MSETVFLFKNLWRKGTILGQSSQDSQHPATDTQEDTKEMYWKSGAIEKLVDGGLNIWTTATDLTNWNEEKIADSTINQEATEKIEGAYSCRLDIDASDSAAYINQIITLIPNKKYKAIIWYKNSVVGKTSYLKIYDSGSNVFLKSDKTWGTGGEYIALANSTVWKKFEIEFYAHTSYSNYYFQIGRAVAASSSIYFDKMSLVECPSIDLDVGEFEPAGTGTMSFYAGTVEPTVGEWLFGEGAQGRVVSVALSTGTWQGEDAAGTVVLEKCEGRFNEDENLTGSVSGENFMKMGTPVLITSDSKVTNGDFSTVVTGWTAINSATLSSVADGKIGNCLKILEDGASNPAAQQTISVIPGKIYKARVFNKAGDEATYQIKIIDKTNGDAVIWSSGSLEETAGDWSTEGEIIFKAPPGCLEIRFRLQQICSEAAGTYLYFDEASLYEFHYPDLVLNGEFENGTGGWTAGNNATVTIEPAGKVGNCILIARNGTNYPKVSQTVTLTVGKKYKLTATAKQKEEATALVFISPSDFANRDAGEEWEAPANWNTTQTWIFEATAATQTLIVQVQTTSGTDGAYFDEISLYELDEEDTEKEIDFFSLLDHNLSPTAQIKLIGAMDATFTKALKTITIPYHEENIRAFLPGKEEVLIDGGLEEWTTATNLTNWTEAISGDSTINRESSEVHGGTYSCRLDVDVGNLYVTIYQGSIPLIPLKKYRIIIWYKNSAIDKTAKITIKDMSLTVSLKADGTWLTGVDSITLPNSTIWKKFELEFYGHADYSSYFLMLERGSAASSSIYFDDVSLARIPLNDRIAIPVLRRYWKPEIIDPDNSDGYIKGAVILTGKHFEPNIDYVKGYSPDRVDHSEIEFTDDMTLYAQEKPVLKRWRLPYWALDDASKEEVLALMEECGNHKAFIVVFDKSNPNKDSHLVRIEEASAPEFQFFNIWTWDLVIKEVK